MERKERIKLIKELDKLASQIIRQRGKCEICGKRETLQCVHIFSRRNFSVRWDLDNLLCLCYRCHHYFAHKEPIRFTEFVKKKLGEKRLKELKMRSDIPVRGQDLNAIKIYLENAYKN